MSSDARINNEPGFILHTYPFKETSVVAEVFTRSHGRMCADRTRGTPPDLGPARVDAAVYPAAAVMVR